MRPKGGSPLAPKARWVPNHNWAHLSQLWPQNGHKDPQDPILANNHRGPIFSPWPLLTTRSAQLKGISPITPCTPYSRLQEWCIYGIIYHYAPFLLRNLMVTFLGQNFMIPKSMSQNPVPILKEDYLTHQSGNPWRQSEDHSRIPITWPCRSLVGNSFRIIPRAIFRGYTLFQSAVKSSSISILLGQLNWSI
ncbi:hypothetical protein O181_123211 [Austropuccinia psidii MF-1]|uniref:Uncharacterized protein n=1 Tax=Austropuccinia psidii MF-1 TaxID=1389203 RepID=A0A9Q3KNT1_9BASI|nr:hypothetical protein [Austropuccinia psidii MF-1]